MQVVKPRKEVGALFEVDVPRAVGEGAGERRVARHATHGGINFHERFEEFEHIVPFDGVQRRPFELFGDRLCGAVEPPVAPLLAHFFELGELLVEVDKRFEVLVVVFEAAVQPLVGVEEEVELRLVHALEVLFIRPRGELLGELGEGADLAQRERGHLLAVKFQKERQKRL